MHIGTCHVVIWSETWVLSKPMMQKLEGFRVGFLRQVTKFKAKRIKYGLWQKLMADKFLQGEGPQPLQTYFDMRHVTVA